ncbi:Androgen-induced -like protein [Halotydeus destructor]|nr:Androgen-induced -like protein [Halotydeus destructor]
MAINGNNWLLWRTLAAMFHLFGAALYTGSLIWVGVNLKPLDGVPVQNQTQGRYFGGHWKYLTHWDHTLQAITFSLFVVVDIIALIEYRKRKQTSGDRNQSPLPFYGHLTKLADGLSHSLAFPIGILVTLLFWTLITVSRDLVVPPGSKEPILWLNQIQHTAVGILILIEHLVSHHERPQTKHGLIPLGIIMIGYLLWVHYIGIVHDYWVYGILAKLNWFSRLLFIFACMSFTAVLYWVGGILHQKVWRAGRKADFEGILTHGK